jgi:hypothetical protein
VYALPNQAWCVASFMRGLNGGSGVFFVRSSRSYSSSALNTPPTDTAASDSVKIVMPGPLYIGLPCRREPGVPPSTGMSTMNPSNAQSAGILTPSKRSVLDPDPLRPSRSPQSSSISQPPSPRGATNISRPGGAPSSAGGRSAWPM